MIFIEDHYVRSPCEKTFQMIKEFIKMTERIVAEIPPHYSEENAHAFIKEYMERRMPGGVDRYLALSARRHRRTTAPQLARDSGGRIDRQTVLQREARRPAGKTEHCGAENISCGHQKNGGVLFSVMSTQSDSCLFFIWREIGAPT
ncbi:hypothetical protein TNCV_4723341 [Trichonephila clavipes]|uniref:Uncharacterized protein n=1 Tax=Trichonephila clavipes TaxID=2585209 RepID=A0A8X7BEV6_TRICX|nr:hypothetical protein TNCV_4723341 [Trichonephila clavipes]